MTLEQNIKTILECNFSIARDEVIEAATKRIMEQIERQNPVEDKENKAYCDRDICLQNEYNGIDCEECIVNRETNNDRKRSDVFIDVSKIAGFRR